MRDQQTLQSPELVRLVRAAAEVVDNETGKITWSDNDKTAESDFTALDVHSSLNSRVLASEQQSGITNTAWTNFDEFSDDDDVGKVVTIQPMLADKIHPIASTAEARR